MMSPSQTDGHMRFEFMSQLQSWLFPPLHHSFLFLPHTALDPCFHLCLILHVGPHQPLLLTQLLLALHCL